MRASFFTPRIAMNYLLHFLYSFLNGLLRRRHCSFQALVNSIDASGLHVWSRSVSCLPGTRSGRTLEECNEHSPAFFVRSDLHIRI
jgi:hypothetical protein